MTHEYVFDYHDGRHLLVHRRRRLGDRPHLHRLRAARQRRDHADVRGRAELSATSRFWEVIDKHKVNIFYTAPTAIRALMREGEEPVKKTSRAVAAPARHRRRADQPGGLAVVPPRRRRGPLPDRRHLVADRDRRHPDHAAARRDGAQAGLGDAAVLRRQAGDRRRRGPRARRRDRGQPLSSPTRGRARCAPSTATTSAS